MWKKILIIAVVVMVSVFLIRKWQQVGSRQAIEQAGGYVEHRAAEFLSDFHTFAQSVTPGSPALTPGSRGVLVKDFGTPSPYRGRVFIDTLASDITPEDPQREYLVLRADPLATSSVSLQGWSLQSMISGVRVFIPDAVSDLVLYEPNPTYYPKLQPGQLALVHTGASPLGISFQTNRCTGYLNNFQTFTPPLPRSCPPPAEIIPPTIENVQALGPACMAFVQEELQSCQYVSEALAEDYELSESCKEALQGVFTYSFCRDSFRPDPDFFRDAQWRLFLDAPRELWADQYEVIRLLDEKGRTVDVWNVE